MTANKNGTTWVVSEELTRIIQKLQHDRHDLSPNATIRFLILRGLQAEGIRRKR